MEWEGKEKGMEEKRRNKRGKEILNRLDESRGKE